MLAPNQTNRDYMLLLSAPMQHISSNASVILEPNKLSDKLSEIESWDITELASSLTNDTRQFNELQCDSKKRLKLLEIYYHSLTEFLSSFDEIKLRTLQLSDTSRLEIEEDIMWLYLEIANGYKILIKDFYESGGSARQDSNYHHSIYRAMELLSQALVYAYKARQIPPPLCFLEINQLYYIAERDVCLAQQVMTIKKEKHEPSIEKLYKQIMMLAVYDPYALNSDEVALMYENLEPFVDDCKIISSGVANAQPGQFLVDLNEDRWPSRYMGQKVRQLKDDQRLLDLTEVLKKQLAESNNDESQDYFISREKQITRIALNSIKNDYYIRNSEKATGVTISMSVGLESVFYYLDNPDQLSVKDTVETCAGIEVSFDDEETGYEITGWNVMQVNGNVHHLTCDASKLNQPLKVGELAIINSAIKQAGSIKLAFIRWVQHTDSEIHAVIEYLPDEYKAMTIRSFGSEDEPTQSLYFLHDNFLRIPASILIENIVVSPDNNYLVRIEGKEFKVSLSRKMRETQVYSLCSFRVNK